jgi:exopolysaccharide production protein ExoQ
MPPQLALSLCTAFVLYLLRLDRKQSPRVSRAVWLPTIWSLLAGSRSLSSWLMNQGEDRLSGSPMDQFFEGSLMLATVIILMRRKVNWAQVFRSNLFLLVLLGYMLMSVVWSDIPDVTFRRWLKEFGVAAMAFLLLTERSPREAVESLLRRTVYILIPFSVLVIKYYQQYGVSYSPWTGEIQWGGVALQKNGLGRLCMISVFFIMWTWTRRRVRRENPGAKYQVPVEILLLMMTVWLLKGPSLWAASVTAMCALIAGLVLLASLCLMQKYHVHLRPSVYAVMLASIMILGIISPFNKGKTVGGLGSMVGRNSTLTGRTDIWASLVPDVEKRPLLGYGFSSFWTPRSRSTHIVAEAHNGYLEVWLGLGIVGLVITVVFILSCSFKAIKALDADYFWGSFCLCFVFMASIHNISESSFDSFDRHLMMIVLFISVSGSRLVPHVVSFKQRAQASSETNFEPALTA